MPAIKDVKEIRVRDPRIMVKINRYRRSAHIRSGHNATEHLIALGYAAWNRQRKETANGKDGAASV